MDGFTGVMGEDCVRSGCWSWLAGWVGENYCIIVDLFLKLMIGIIFLWFFAFIYWTKTGNGEGEIVCGTRFLLD